VRDKIMNENLKKIFKYDSVWQARLYIGAKTFVYSYIQLIVILAGICLIGYLKYVQKMSASPIIQYVMFLMIVFEIINDADIAIVTSQSGGVPLITEQLISLIPISIEFIILHMYVKGKKLIELIDPVSIINVVILCLLVNMAIGIIQRIIVSILFHYYQNDTEE
jgi:hypothetical protein